MKVPALIQRLGGALLMVLLALPVHGQSSEGIDTERVQASVEEAVKRLELTPEQQEAAQPILEASMLQRLEIMQKYGIDLSGEGPLERPGLRTGRRLRGELRDLNETTEAQLQDVLTDEQMDTWKLMQEEGRERLQDRFEDG